MSNQVTDNQDVQHVLEQYSPTTREKLAVLRQLIFEVVAELNNIGEIQETLKWGQISYLTQRPKSGTTIRMDQYGDNSEQVALFVHCQTNLINMFQLMYPHDFQYEGSRAVIINDMSDEHRNALKHFIELALTYHLRKSG